MPTNFPIPRQTDRELVVALKRVQGALKPIIELQLVVAVPRKGNVTITHEPAEEDPQLKFIFDLGSTVLEQLHLRAPGGNALTVRRTLDAVSDVAGLQDEWIGHVQEPSRAITWVTLQSEAQKELRTNDVVAAFKGHEDTAWNRYRDAQASVVNSLQQALETLLVKTADKNAELDRARSARFEKLESDLRQELADSRKKLQAEFEGKEAALGERTKAVADREASFNTKEARYVARKKQEEQIEQIQKWLEDWHLTKGTTEKRAPIRNAYIAALIFTGILTLATIIHNFAVIKDAQELAKLTWWQWVGLMAKAFFPLAAFSSFMVAFIRWSGEWARQHSEEEFRNRSRLIDIGRSSWLLEAVRDAHERNKDIPPDLMKELSRNLFTHTASSDAEVHPPVAADLLLQGLSSLRVKSSDGTEVEAKRRK